MESLFGDYDEALTHLKNNLLCTKNPEEIRRGIFRYCYELAKGRYPATEDDRKAMDDTFANALFAEPTIPFEEVLTKFTLKHSAGADKFLQELKDILSNYDQNAESKKYIEIVEQFQRANGVV